MRRADKRHSTHTEHCLCISTTKKAYHILGFWLVTTSGYKPEINLLFNFLFDRRLYFIQRSVFLLVVNLLS